MYLLLVTLVGAKSGRMQQILVDAVPSEELQDFVNGIEDLEVEDPRVIDVQVVKTKTETAASV